MASPTSRSLVFAKSIGFTAGVVEKWNSHCRIRQDLFGCIDLIAVKDGIGIIGVQACAGASHAARKAKALAEPRLREWLASGGRFEIWSWAKQGARGKRKVWTLRREEIFVGDVHEDACENSSAGIPTLIDGSGVAA